MDCSLSIVCSNLIDDRNGDGMSSSSGLISFVLMGIGDEGEDFVVSVSGGSDSVEGCLSFTEISSVVDDVMKLSCNSCTLSLTTLPMKNEFYFDYIEEQALDRFISVV